MHTPAYHLLRIGSDLVLPADGLSVTWVERAWEEAAQAERRGIRFLTLPDGAAAILKIYRPRPKHGYWRRIRESRAIREGRGYRTFRAHGIATPPLLLYGERRRGGRWEMGAVATARLPALPVSEAYSSEPDPRLLMETASVLADVHRGGLTHGDPRLRNFLATRPRPTPFDLTSWGRITGPSQARDLVRFLGSTLVLTRDEALTAAVLARYRRTAPPPAVKDGEVLFAAARYASEKGAP